MPSPTLAGAQLPEALIVAIGDIFSTRYAEMASTAIILWDHCITFGDEVDLIWKSSWSLGKIIFLINRYYTLFSVIFNKTGLFGTNHSEKFCRVFFHWQGWTGLVAVMLAEVILQMRLYALYFLNKKILLLMVVSFIVNTTASAVIMGTALSKITVRTHLGSNVWICLPNNIPDYFYTFWIPVLVQETLLCTLALLRGYTSYRQADNMLSSGRRLVNTLVRDSLFYFLVIFATYLTCLLVWSTARQTLLEIPIGLSVAMSCTLGNRIILNVRKAKEKLDYVYMDGVSVKQTEMTVSLGIGSDPDSPESRFSAPALTDFEMTTLRSLRADSARKPFTTM